MSKSNSTENAFLSLVYNATPWANIADNAATSPVTNIYITLNSASPGEAGNASTSEVAYTGYARVPVARTSGGWTVSNGVVVPVANIDFPTCTGGTATATHFTTTTAVSGASAIIHYGTITPSISISTSVLPRLTTATSIAED